MEPFNLKDHSFFTINEWENNYQNLVVGFTTKNGGISSGDYQLLNMGFHVGDQLSSVFQNRTLLANKLNFPLQQWVGAEQTHDIHIHKVTKVDCGKGATTYNQSIKKTDGFYTTEPGILLTAVFADCVPLFFIAPKHRLLGIAHAGWRGTIAGIGSEMIRRLKQEGVNPNDVKTVIGPSICSNCYIVDNYVISKIKIKLEDNYKNTYNLREVNQYQLNLPELNRQILLTAGVPKDNIRMTNLCTSCNKNVFFSHRRDHGHTGRMMGFIGWKEV